MPAAPTAIRTRRSAGPATYSEEYINQAGAFQTQLTSLIAEGVFAKFPDLTVVLMESGVTWLPGYLWRLTKFWKGLRSEVPWVADPPATIVRDRVRLTLQPFDGPPDPATITRFMEHMGSDETAAVLDRLSALAVRGHRRDPGRA